LGIEQLGDLPRGREGDPREGVPASGGGNEGVGRPWKDPCGRCGPDGTYTHQRASLRHRREGSCAGLQGKAERNVTHPYGPRGPMGPTSDMRAAHFGQTSTALRAVVAGLLARGGLGASARAPARSRARARCSRLDGAKSP